MEGPISKGGYHENRKGASKWAIGVPIKYVLHSLVFNYSRPHNVVKSWIYFNTFGTESKLTQKKQQQKKKWNKTKFWLFPSVEKAPTDSQQRTYLSKWEKLDRDSQVLGLIAWEGEGGKDYNQQFKVLKWRWLSNTFMRNCSLHCASLY